jgi:cyanophycinase
MGGNEFRPNCIPMDERLLAELKRPAPRVVIVPTAAAHQNPALAARNGSRYFSDLGANTTSAMILKRSDADDPARLAELDVADAIYLTGGDPAHLLDALRGSAFLDYLRQFVAAGGWLIGSSAGAMVLCERTRTRLTGEWTGGLNLVPGVAVLPHHDEFRQGPVALLRQGLPRSVILLGIDTATAVATHDSINGQVWGGGQAMCYTAHGSQRFTTGDWFALSA